MSMMMRARSTRPPRHIVRRGCFLALGLFACATVWSQPMRPGQHGKLLLTGGVSSIDGAAGGGLTPWAVTGSYATRGEIGATAHLTRLTLRDYDLNMAGVAVAWDERLELSLAHQDLDARSNLVPLSATLANLRIRQNIFGAKLRIAGDAVLESDSWMPQLAFGLLHKRSDSAALRPVLQSLGARPNGTEAYLSATKLFLAQSVLVNGTLRATRANQNGLLGFGGTGHNNPAWVPEVSVAYLINKHLAVGAEYRAKPDPLALPTSTGNGLQEDAWQDLFLAWAPNKHLSLTLAFVDLGRIAPAVVSRRQTGTYLSAQVAF